MAIQPAIAQGSLNHFSGVSPPTKNVLVELFTSDGCDSCPPANHWMSEVVQKGDARIVPVSMHVTYWNHLGWKDPASNLYFDKKQEGYSKLGLARFSYTPAVFLSGAEWSGWRNNDISKIKSLNQQPALLKIEVKADIVEERNVKMDIQVSTHEKEKGASTLRSKQFVYLYEDGVIDKPNAGELKGATLRHDHVIKAWDERAVGSLPKQTHLQFDIPKGVDPKKLGMVVFIQSEDGRDIAQVIDVPLHNPS